MQRVYWTVDLLEAHIVVGLLREEGIPAWVFDADMVRQDWFRALAIGGYRIMVTASAVPEALAIVARYSEADRPPIYADSEMPACPVCSHRDAADDPRPRRRAFIALIVLEYVLGMVLFAVADDSPTTQSAFLAVYSCLQFALIFPGALGFIVKHRYRCRRCGNRFHDTSGPSFNELSMAVDRADSKVG